MDELRKYKGNLKDQEAFDLLKKQFIGEFISSLNSPEYIANQYAKLYFEGVYLFDARYRRKYYVRECKMKLQLFLNFDQLVDSRLEMENR